MQMSKPVVASAGGRIEARQDLTGLLSRHSLTIATKMAVDSAEGTVAPPVGLRPKQATDTRTTPGRHSSSDCDSHRGRIGSNRREDLCFDKGTGRFYWEVLSQVLDSNRVAV